MPKEGCYGEVGIRTVSANTQVDLLIERVGLVGFGDTKNSVLNGTTMSVNVSF
jgi:hypothetical protein